ncbi:MAG: hypothetical protein P8Z79_20595 [Sedimentisphaerales bacterium]|jgi:hypothetical protein
MSHLEELIYQYYEWKGYVVRRNTKVGRLRHGGWECELDIVAFRHQDSHLIHLEPSIDAHSWAKREDRFKKKFEAGRKYIFKEIFPWLSPSMKIEQVAILISRGTKELLAGCEIITIDEFVKNVKDEILKEGYMAKNAIPELYDLLRTIQMTICGYYKIL